MSQANPKNAHNHITQLLSEFHKYTLNLTLTVGRAVSGALHTPQLEGAHAVTGGPKFSSVPT